MKVDLVLVAIVIVIVIVINVLVVVTVVVAEGLVFFVEGERRGESFFFFLLCLLSPAMGVLSCG